ncbi:helix-turn-helix domain-containing protein [Bdellovibrio sp. NC01]|uniref:helix-turn-helix domain-containing protein n=1 Tax=Bdellovibrio sp. NC01 TaxID=2220073 RepID=UPI00115B1D91|nr:helix-turn-helix transcriptional regulator [Bdellovibrio sp. NC01]QDK38167.1 hypothetical protein DOE51_11525 [Bdellovibrio sp. NC01]
MNTFGLYIKQLRINKRLTQSEAAQLLGKDQQGQYISNIERGQSVPSIEVLKKLCEIYSVQESEMTQEYMNLCHRKVSKKIKSEWERCASSPSGH